MFVFVYLGYWSIRRDAIRFFAETSFRVRFWALQVRSLRKTRVNLYSRPWIRWSTGGGRAALDSGDELPFSKHFPCMQVAMWKIYKCLKEQVAWFICCRFDRVSSFALTPSRLNLVTDQRQISHTAVLVRVALSVSSLQGVLYSVRLTLLLCTSLVPIVMMPQQTQDRKRWLARPFPHKIWNGKRRWIKGPKTYPYCQLYLLLLLRAPALC